MNFRQSTSKQRHKQKTETHSQILQNEKRNIQVYR